MSLASLLHEAPVEFSVRVIDDHAGVRGRLRVALQPGQLPRDGDAAAGDPDEHTLDLAALAPPPSPGGTAEAAAAAAPLAARRGHKMRFVVTLLDAADVPREYTDVLCQFHFSPKVRGGFF